MGSKSGGWKIMDPVAIVTTLATLVLGGGVSASIIVFILNKKKYNKEVENIDTTSTLNKSNADLNQVTAQDIIIKNLRGEIERLSSNEEKINDKLILLNKRMDEIILDNSKKDEVIRNQKEEINSLKILIG